ncbi:MAG: SDR family NAD(P)-dependent oxidoreductase [Chloroflexi bacterium]|nr:SDR family NAD(P)-dependent oxidoreductase [Chloroflexota bacterium]
MSTLRVLVLTGASRGLGEAIAYEAARQGFALVLNARHTPRLVRVAKKIEAFGVPATIVAGDIALPMTARRLAQAAQQAFGRVDVVVNNAAIIQPIGPIAQLDPYAWTYNWQVNVLGPAMVVQATLPMLRASQGRVINISSGAGVKPYPSWAPYATAKAALNHFTRILAAEEPTITALALRPGVIDTDMQRFIREHGASAMPRELYERFLAYRETGRLEDPRDVARVVVALAARAPRAWSGAFLSYDEPRVQALLAEHEEQRPPEEGRSSGKGRESAGVS